MFKALNGPKRIKSLPDNYRSLGIAAALLICSLCASAQRSSLLTPYDSNRVFQAISGYGFGWNNVYIKGSIIIPNDTPRLALKDRRTKRVVRRSHRPVGCDRQWRRHIGGPGHGC